MENSTKKNFDKKVMLDITAVNPRWPPVVIMQKCLFISHHDHVESTSLIYL